MSEACKSHAFKFSEHEYEVCSLGVQNCIALWLKAKIQQTVFLVESKVGSYFRKLVE